MLTQIPGVHMNPTHTHTAIWKEKGMFNVEKNQVKYGLNILGLLEVAVIQCRGHQRVQR